MYPMKRGKVVNILYSVTVSSESTYDKLFSKSEKKPLQQAMKYHRLLCEGLSALDHVNVHVISKLPINRSNFKKNYLKSESEIKNKVNYYYISIVNLPLIKNVFAFFTVLYTVIKRCDRDTVIVGDVLNITTSMANIMAGRIKGVKTIGIVTDIPSHLASSNKNSHTERISRFKNFTVKLNNFILQKFDSYIFLTEQMNELINKEGKPYIVMEGHIDSQVVKLRNTLEGKYPGIVCQYAGSLKKIYGIEKLTRAFIHANVEGSELHIYGDGDFVDELQQICAQHPTIRYFGVKLNQYIVNEQLKSTLLINPRPTDEEYTKYSYPSKNMEYMASGTPTLTTKLAGMPEEYYDYIYLIEDESLEGLTKTLQHVLGKSKEELHEKGLKAKEFVLLEKNNIVQAEKLLKLIQQIQ
ncbi:glycosyl transferase family 1 [Sporosarcina sp. P16a]|nr:glycosyl transferase family 1 [Sporosarcina sp. P16a]PIC94342.1 glycosyl transferase family 1 [Sporosarcina sp. P25]